MERLLGKLQVKHDPRTLRMARYFRALPAAPAACDYTVKVPSWPMLANDRLGDCTFAGAGHLAQCWSDNAGTPFMPDDAETAKEYLAFTGGVDSGCVELDVLNLWRTNGILGHKIGAYAALAQQNHEELRNAIYLFGGAYLGVELPLIWQGQQVWDAPALRIGRAVPGSWGGHCVPAVAYNSTGPIVVTWGGLLQVTWAGYDAYFSEAYAILSTDWLTGGKNPQGVDIATLNADLAEVGQMDTPPMPVPPAPVPPQPLPPGPTPVPPVNPWGWLGSLAHSVHFPSRTGDWLSIGPATASHK